VDQPWVEDWHAGPELGRRDEKRSFFRHGKVIASATNSPRDQLSQLLVSSARIGKEQVEQAFAVAGREPDASRQDPGDDRQHLRE
jgi:hypothetical protein